MNFKKRVNGSWVDIPSYIRNTSTDTITTLPAVIYTDGTNATVSLKGNTVQSNTPTLDNPIMPQGVGERSGNLFDGQLQQGFYAYLAGNYTLADTYVCTHLIPCTENTTYTFRCINTGGGSKNYGYVFFDSTQNRIGSDYINVLTEGDVVTHTATAPQNTAFLAIDIAYGRRQASVVRPSDITDFMLNSGSTAKPYEPYGYKIPISSTNTTTPVYLGEVETTRKIKKLVFDGTENLIFSNSDDNRSVCYLRDLGCANALCLCTHIEGKPSYSSNEYNRILTYTDFNGVLYISIEKGLVGSTLETFKAYLASQYAAGTPVTVWYVLAKPETGIVNEPLMKIGKYVDELANVSIPTTVGVNTLSVDTTVQPSEFTVTWTGWHDTEVKAYVSATTIADWESVSILQMENYTIQELQGGNWI